MIFALVGNQNCGKTTIFNEMTNMNGHVGNFPGVTVETISGKLVGRKDCEVIDLPGLYSLNTYTKEEQISKEFLYKAKPDALINVINSTKIERNLYLTLQLKELNVPMIIALNMIDKLEANNGKIDADMLSKKMEVPIVTITNANKNEINNLVQKTISIASQNYNINNVEKNKEKIIEKYKLIDAICKEVAKLPKNDKEKVKSYKIDKILTNKILGIPIFLVIMFLIFYLTFNCIGPYFTDLINKGIEVINGATIDVLNRHGASIILQQLVSEGIFSGIGSVVGFLPIIVILYFFLSLLEDSGYMSIIAFIMDKILRILGLSGRSIVPILLGFGCSVPAILSLRTIQSERERRLVLNFVPFISCSAKIPIYAILVTVFFKEYAVIAMILIYCIGIVIGIMAMTVIRKKVGSNINEDFIMELPNYRMPTLKNTWRLMWNKTKEFIDKVFSVIFIASIIIWFLKSFDLNINYVEEGESILALIAKKMTPIFVPLGFSNWRVITSLIVGITAKEAVISTLSILCNNNLVLLIPTMFNKISAISFIIFILLYTPCIASIAVIRKEFNTKTALQVAFNQLLIAYVFSAIIYNLGNLIFI